MTSWDWPRCWAVAPAWAVGDYMGSDHTLHPLIAHWDGASWKVVIGPDQRGSLESVAAVGAHDVRAVGYIPGRDANTNYSPWHLLIEQWNGTAWQVAPNAEPGGAADSGLHGITTDGAGNYWAVGYSINAENEHPTLILHCP